jgi:hypothetical protein
VEHKNIFPKFESALYHRIGQSKLENNNTTVRKEMKDRSGSFADPCLVKLK